MNFVCFTVSPTAKFNIMVTHPCNSYSFTSHFCIVKLGFTGVYIFLIFALKHRLWVHVGAEDDLLIYILDQSPMSYHAFDNSLTIKTLIKQVTL